MTEADVQLMRLAQFANTLLVPATEAVRAAQDEVQWPWALGTLLEAGAWICLGVELRYFPRKKSLAVLERTIGRISRLDEAGGNWGRIVGNSWTERLGYGHLDDALAVQVFPVPLDQPGRLHAQYEAALVHAVTRTDDEVAARVQRAMLFERDDVWNAEVSRHSALLAELRREEPARGDGPAWTTCAGAGAWIADGLVRCLGDVEATLNWAALGLGLSSDSEDLEIWLDRVGDPRTDDEVLASWVGKIVGWRVSRRDLRAGERLAEARLLTSQFERDVVRRGMSSPWPDGFMVVLDRALERWEVLTAQVVLR